MDNHSRPLFEPLDSQAKVVFGRFEAQYPECIEGLGLHTPGTRWLVGRGPAKPAVNFA